MPPFDHILTFDKAVPSTEPIHLGKNSNLLITANGIGVTLTFPKDSPFNPSKSPVVVAAGMAVILKIRGQAGSCEYTVTPSKRQPKQAKAKTNPSMIVD